MQGERPRANTRAMVASLELTRRTFLGRSLQAAGALAALPALAYAPCALASPSEALLAFGPSELPILEAVAATFVPAGGAFATGAADVDLARRVDALVAAQGPDVVRGVRGALWVVELASPLLAGRVTRFRSLPPPERTRCLAALMESRLALARDVFAGLRQLCLFSFYSQDASWAATGYDGPWVRRTVGAA